MSNVPNLSCAEVEEFIGHYFPSAGPTLFIGNVGFSPDVLYFPSLLGPLENVDVRLFYERRPGVPHAISAVATERRLRIEEMATNPVEVKGRGHPRRRWCPCGRAQRMLASAGVARRKALYRRCGRCHGDVAMHIVSHRQATPPAIPPDFFARASADRRRLRASSAHRVGLE